MKLAQTVIQMGILHRKENQQATHTHTHPVQEKQLFKQRMFHWITQVNI